jgi:hypothetical protein
MPKRIQRKRTRGFRMGDAVYVGRPTIYGNPFVTVGEFMAYCEQKRRDDPEGFAEWIAPLRGKDLACWCPLELPCHAEVLLRLANAHVRA